MRIDAQRMVDQSAGMDAEGVRFLQAVARYLELQNVFGAMGVMAIHGVEKHHGGAGAGERGQTGEDQMGGASAEAEVGPRNSPRFGDGPQQALAVNGRRSPRKERKKFAQLVNHTRRRVEPRIEHVGADYRFSPAEIAEGRSDGFKESAAMKRMRNRIGCVCHGENLTPGASGGKRQSAAWRG